MCVSVWVSGCGERQKERKQKEGWVIGSILVWEFPYENISFLLVAQVDKESACQCRRYDFSPWVRKIPWRREWKPTPVFLPGNSYSLAGLYSMESQRLGHNSATKTQWSLRNTDKQVLSKKEKLNKTKQIMLILQYCRNRILILIVN